MTGIRIGDLLAVLTAQEKSDFQRFVDSPFFNDGPSAKDEALLLAYLLRIQGQPADEEDEEGFDRLAAYEAVFPGQRFVEKKLEKLLSNLHALLKHFIIVKYRETEKFEGEIAQLRFFRDRGLHSRYENQSRNLLIMLEQHVHSRAKIKDSFLLKYELCQYEYLFNNKKAHQIIPEVLEDLEADYLTIKLELINQYLLAQKKVLFEMPEDMQGLLNQNQIPDILLSKHPNLLLAHKISNLFRPALPNVDSFFELQALLQKYEPIIAPEEAQIFAVYLRNLCFLLVINNHSEYLPVLFNLQKEHYRSGYLSHEGKISPFAVLGVSNTALMVGEIEWCEQFLAETEHNILGETPEKHYFNLCKANLLFYQKQYQPALDILPLNFSIMEYLLFSRRLEIKCYYELASDLLDYKLDAFKMYLSRASKTLIAESVRERNANFLNMLIQINKHSGLKSKEHVQKLLARIEAKTQITDREWLVEKAASL